MKFEFEANHERDAYIQSRGLTILNACPGSGKTTCVAKKILLLENECLEKFGKYSGLACLSFTNIAKNEISRKCYELNNEIISFPHLVSTIDSFINRYITLPFYYLLKKDCKRPIISENLSFIDDIWKGKFRYKDQLGKSFCFKYPPSSINFNSEGKLSSNGFIPEDSTISNEVWSNYCSAIWDWKLKNGYIGSSDSAYIAYDLLSKHKSIGVLLSRRYPYLIIDEAQDTSEIQYKIFDHLINSGLVNVDLVGDPYQSLYEWRDAAPKLFIDKCRDELWTSLQLTENRRSPQHIIDIYSLLRRSCDPRIKSSLDVDSPIPVCLYKYNSGNIHAVISHYEKLCKDYMLANNQIVVRGNKLKNQMLGVCSEQKPWRASAPYLLLEAKQHYEGNSLREAFKLIRGFLIELHLENSDINGKSKLEKELRLDHKFNSSIYGFIKNIPSFENSIFNWTKLAQKYLKEFTGKDFDFGIKSKNSQNFSKDVLGDPVLKYFPKPYTKGNIKITTIHKVKGETLSSILIFFNEKKHKENISFSDISIPEKDLPEERKRLIYVAQSRPTALLAMAFHESVGDADIYKKFGNSVVILEEKVFNPLFDWTFSVENMGLIYMASAYDAKGNRRLTYSHDDQNVSIESAKLKVLKYLI